MARQCHSCDYPWCPDESECPNCGASPPACFITTAVCSESGLPDDCHELTVLRAFRDRHMNSSAERQAMVNQYYSQAPGIVERINSSPRRTAIYNELRERFIGPAVEAASKGDDLVAESTYIRGMQWVAQHV